ncbi:hypothetical protein FRB98_008840 [Tulasnella sp. 332]|nr:hypothetical protein FRB98_008840 [Tulasnella sp. 332]
MSTMLSFRATAKLLSSRSGATKGVASFVRRSSSSRPPKSLEDSTSALDYKSNTQRRTRPPPLPASYMPQGSRTAEEAVTNILYNTPPPSTQPYKKHILNCLVQNEPGVLSRVSGCLAARGFNIDSLVVCRTEIKDLSRMCIVLGGQDGVVEQVPVWAVLDYTETPTIARELLLAKVSTIGPEYLEDQLSGGPTLETRRASELRVRENKLAETFEKSAIKTFHAATSTPSSEEAHSPATNQHHPDQLTVSEVLRNRHIYFAAIRAITDQFGGRIVDISENSVIVELSGKSSRVEAFLGLLRPFGLLEAARTGLMVMPRTPITTSPEDDDAQSASSMEAVDVSLLPPG